MNSVKQVQIDLSIKKKATLLKEEKKKLKLTMTETKKYTRIMDSIKKSDITSSRGTLIP